MFFARFFRVETGATTPQYAVVLAVVLLGLLFGASILGQATHFTFGRMSASLADDAESPAETAAVASSSKTVSVTSEQRLGYCCYMVAAFLLSVLFFSCWYYWMLKRFDKPEKLEMDEIPREDTTWSPEVLFAKRQQLLRLFAAKRETGLRSSSLCVADLMTKEPFAVLPSTPIDEVEKLMKRKKVRHILVCDADRTLLGVISDRDFAKLRKRTAGCIMTPDPITTKPDLPLIPVITIMFHHRISCLPVLEDGKLVGILTITDLLMALQCSFHILQQVARETPCLGENKETFSGNDLQSILV